MRNMIKIKEASNRMPLYDQLNIKLGFGGAKSAADTWQHAVDQDQGIDDE